MKSGPDSEKNYADSIGSPGLPPFRRGIYDEMYRQKIWTMRQYSGFSNPSKTNQRFHSLLEGGQTGLSVAFDLPTQLGMDSDDPLSIGEVGRVGVAIDSIHDMRELFSGIDLSNVSTSMTINAPATTLLALYVAVSDEMGISRSNISGTVQNDILKEYISRGLYIYPPDHSIRLTTDLMSWCRSNLPKWNTISVSGYHLREAGCTATQEIAMTISNALYYVRSAIESGLEVDDFAPRVSFFFACHNNFIEEVAKFRAARELWHQLMVEEFKPKNIKSSMLRFHTQTSGVTLTAQQPMNNAIRVSLQAMSSIFGGTQSLHTNSFDEALGLPTNDSALLALRTQQIIAEESGIANFPDPFGGSIIVEEMTDKLIRDAKKLIVEIDDAGGPMECVKSGMQQSLIHESAWAQLQRIEGGDELVVGVNSHSDGTVPEFETTAINEKDEEEKISKLREIKKNRDSDLVKESLKNLKIACINGTNLMEPLIEAMKVEATVGEVNGVMREIFGTWMSPSGV